MKIKSAFTLAEVLITLGIIGVISAMTLPSLNSDVNIRTLETGTMKAYNMLQNAANRYLTDNEADNFNDVEFDPDSFIKKYFKVVVSGSSASAVFPSTYKTLSKNTENNSKKISDIASDDFKAYKLNDGSILQIQKDRTIVIDINGKKKPNVVNKDLWVLSLKDDGSVRDYLSGSTITAITQNFTKCRLGTSLYGCFDYFITNGFKFNYDTTYQIVEEPVAPIPGVIIK